MGKIKICSLPYAWWKHEESYSPSFLQTMETTKDGVLFYTGNIKRVPKDAWADFITSVVLSEILLCIFESFNKFFIPMFSFWVLPGTKKTLPTHTNISMLELDSRHLKCTWLSICWKGTPLNGICFWVRIIRIRFKVRSLHILPVSNSLWSA